MKHVIQLLLALMLASTASAVEYTRVVGVAPAQDGASIAVEIALGSGVALSGLRWFNNDAEQVFPKVVIVEGEAGAVPDLTSPGLILDEVTGVSLGWGELTLNSPVTSSTGIAFAVFFFPVGELVTSLGQGGGPGLGIRETTDPAAPFHVSSDALSWAEFETGYELGVEPVVAALRGEARAIKDVGVRIDLPESAVAEGTVRYTTELHTPYPNPFNPRVRLSFSLESSSSVSLRVYDVRGRLIRGVVSGEYSAGSHAALWNGDDAHGRKVASGVYFARFEAGPVTQVQRMVLLR